MPGPVGASSIPTPDPFKLIHELQERAGRAEARLDKLEAAPRPMAALAMNAAALYRMPEEETPAAIARIIAACVAHGYEEERLRLFESDMHDALVDGVPEQAIIDHYFALIDRHGPFAALYNVDHGAALRLDKSLYPLLVDGTGIGYSIVFAALDPVEYKRMWGWTLDEVNAMERPGEFITNVKLYVDTNGLQGWRPRANDPRGRSSDDDLFGEPKP